MKEKTISALIDAKAPKTSITDLVAVEKRGDITGTLKAFVDPRHCYIIFHILGNDGENAHIVLRLPWGKVYGRMRKLRDNNKKKEGEKNDAQKEESKRQDAESANR